MRRRELGGWYMERRLVALALILVLAMGTADAHRMLLGYKVNEMQLKAMYDDGTPAQGAEIVVYKDGRPVYNGTADDDGQFIYRPEGDLEGLSFVSSSAGHRTELNLSQSGSGPVELPLAARTAAGLGILLGAAGISMIYISRKKESNNGSSGKDGSKDSRTRIQRKKGA